jgi:GNAT superfamily N-acetyltransferase
MAQLRPHLVESEFLKRIRRQQLSGFSMVRLEENGIVEGVAGFRISESLYYGRFLYVDDLVTNETSRSRGHGTRLFDWLVTHARETGCDSLALDSGVQRFQAHRFYLKRGMDITCHHFALRLK